MKCWRIKIVEQTEIDAFLFAPTLRDAKEMARRGDYDKLSDTAIPCPDKIKRIRLDEQEQGKHNV